MIKNSYHAEQSESVVKQLNSAPNGLSSQEAAKRLYEYGPNSLSSTAKVPILHIFVNQINNPLTYILIVAAAISYFTGHLFDSYVIFTLVVINTSIGFYHEYKAAKIVKSLQERITQKCKVYRDGNINEITIEQLVPGDILLITEGDKVPADARIISARRLTVIESALTGEAAAVEKSIDPVPIETILPDRTNMLFRGTSVTTGDGSAIIVATGNQTEIGKISTQIADITAEASLFRQRTERLAKQMLFVSLATTSLIFVLALAYRTDTNTLLSFTLASLVSGMPEGLPSIMTVVLSMASYRMAKRSAVVRNLTSIETLSTVTTIITDKTGTLTQNSMTIKSMLLGSGELLQITGEGWEPKGQISYNAAPLPKKLEIQLRKIMELLSISTRAEVHEKDGKYSIIGDPTEAARLVLTMKAGIDKTELLKNRYQILDELHYNQITKYHTLLVKDLESNKKLIIIAGGAENILKLSTYFFATDEQNRLTESAQVSIRKWMDEQASRSMRIQAVASCEVDSSIETLPEQLPTQFSLLTTLSIHDPVRPDVYSAIEMAKGAGIRVIMATGDFQQTAFAIAKETGIIPPESALSTKTDHEFPPLLTGAQIAEMDDETFARAASQVSVFARLTPDMKYRLATTLQKLGEVVAMTGDGVNDSLALKRADIAISMGKIGTDAAREASDIVLVDDNFATIVNAIEEGRAVFNNIRRTSLYLVCTNFAEAAMVIIAMVMGTPLPMLPIHILWINLVTDGVNDIALSMESVHEDVLKHKPRGKSEAILDRESLQLVCVIAGAILLVTLITFTLYKDTELEKARTLTFSVMVFAQLFSILSFRSMKSSLFKLGVFSNRYLIWSITGSVIALIILLYQPAIRTAMQFSPITAVEFILCALVASSILWVAELFKYLKSANTGSTQ